MLLFEYARAFGESGYRGVYRFVQWLRRLSERGMEPERGAAGKAVRIMSIHKSKGLEFPFVFLCDLGHRFNQTDTRACVLLHTALGLGPKRVDPALGLEYPTLARRAIAHRLTSEMLSEEMRVLYVGMTRARERLMMSCVWKNAEEALSGLRLTLRQPQPPEVLRGAASFAPWIAGAALSDPETLPITLHTPDGLSAEEEAPAPEGADVPADAGAMRALEEALDFVYPWARSADLPAKLTATELKGLLDADADADSAPLTPPPPSPPERTFRRPDFAAAPALSAAERGTATHAFLQYVDFARTGSVDALRAEAERLTAAGWLSEAERDAIDLPSVARLFASPLGTEMRSASDLRREFRFLLLCDAGDYAAEAAPDDRIMLQGVVDCFFIRDGAITIVDYKTDRVAAAEVPARAEAYRGQMLAYAGALKRIFGLPIRQCVLWFLHPGAEHEIPLENQGKIL
jgi:ATP-dependent helicase/nuclease subunit A